MGTVFGERKKHTTVFAQTFTNHTALLSNNDWTIIFERAYDRVAFVFLPRCLVILAVSLISQSLTSSFE